MYFPPTVILGLTNTHDDAVAKSLEVLYPFIGRLQNIVEKLDTFSSVNLAVFPITKGLCQVLMDQSSHHAPPRRVVHHEHMVSLCNEMLRHQRHGSIAGGRGLFVHELLDDPSICEDDGGPWAQLQTVHAPILLCPFCEPVKMVGMGYISVGLTSKLWTYCKYGLFKGI